MNTAYKINTAIFIVIFASISSFKISAQQCATLKFAPGEKNGEEYVSFVTWHNGRDIRVNKDKYDIINNEQEYHFEEGEHTLTVEQWPLEVFRSIRKGKKIKKKYLSFDRITKNIKLNVKAQRYYSFEIISNPIGLIPTKIVLTNETEKSCDIDGEAFFKAKDNPHSDIARKSTVLPESLEYRLRRLMNVLHDYKESIGDEQNTSFFLPSLSQYIGATIDSEYAENGTAIKVLSVFPYSLANNLQLLSGDKITNLNGEEIQNDNLKPEEVIYGFMKKLYVGEPFKINVIRNAEIIELSGNYSPNILPEVDYQFLTNKQQNKPNTLINHGELPPSLDIEFAHLILDITHHHQDSEYNYITLIREERVDNSFGFSGKGIVIDGVTGLKLEKVEPESYAEKLGLLKGDTIVKVNNGNADDSKDVVKLVNSITNQKIGQVLTLTINRDGETITLSERYQPQILIGFELVIDMNSLERAKVALAKVMERNRRYYADDKWRERFTYGARDRQPRYRSNKDNYNSTHMAAKGSVGSGMKKN